MGLGAAFFCALALVGLRAVIAQVEWVYIGFKMLGGAYLLYLAWRLWRGAATPMAVQEMQARRSGAGLARSFLLALATQLSNPKTIVVISGIFAALLPAHVPVLDAACDSAHPVRDRNQLVHLRRHRDVVAAHRGPFICAPRNGSTAPRAAYWARWAAADFGKRKGRGLRGYGRRRSVRFRAIRLGYLFPEFHLHSLNHAGNQARDGTFHPRGISRARRFDGEQAGAAGCGAVISGAGDVAYITVQFAANENAAQRWVAHTYQVIASLRQVLADAQDAETGQRGFILTHQPSFLAPYRAASGRVERDLTPLQATDRRQSRPAAPRRSAGHAGPRAFFRSRHVAESRPERHAVAGRWSRRWKRARPRMDALRAEVAAGMARSRRCFACAIQQRDEQERYWKSALPSARRVLALGILLIAAAMLVRNNVSLSAGRARPRQ